MVKKDEKTNLKLKEDEIAFVMDAKGNIQLIFPDLDNEDVVPDHVLLMSAIAVTCTSDAEVIELIQRKFAEITDKVKAN